MSEEPKPSYEKHFQILEGVTESLGRDEISVDDLMERTREALQAARVCLDILQKQKGEFSTLQQEFEHLMAGLDAGGEPGRTDPPVEDVPEDELPF